MKSAPAETFLHGVGIANFEVVVLKATLVQLPGGKISPLVILLNGEDLAIAADTITENHGGKSKIRADFKNCLSVSFRNGGRLQDSCIATYRG